MASDKYDPTAYYLSVRSYMAPRVDIMRGGETFRSFRAPTVDEAKAMAREFAKRKGITLEELSK